MSRWPTVVALVVALAGGSPTAFAETDDVAVSLQAIERLRRSGDVEGAAKQAADLVAKHPAELPAHVMWQDLQLALGHDKEVLESYRTAAKEETATADAHYLLARLQRGNAAVGEYRAALKLDPQHFRAKCGLGLELIGLRAYADAKNLLEDAAALQPKSAVPVNALGRVEEARDKPADAEKRYRTAIELDPALTVARVNLGTLLVGQGKREDGMKVLREAAAAAPRDPVPLLAIGMAQVAANDVKGALETYRSAADLERDNVTTLNLLAKAYADLQQPDMAEQALQQALKKAPGSVVTKINLAFLRITKLEYGEAVEFALAAVAIDDDSPEAHYVLGLAYDHSIQPKKADVEYRKAAKLDPDNALYVRAGAALAGSMGEWARSVAEFQKACRMTGNSSASLLELGGAYVAAGKARSAASTYDQIVAADPGFLDAWLDLGIVCMRDLKEKGRAAKAFREYKAHGGKDPRVDGWLVQLDAK